MINYLIKLSSIKKNVVFGCVLNLRILHNSFAEDILTFRLLTGFFLHSPIVTCKIFSSGHFNVIMFCLNIFKHSDETIRNRFLLIKLGLLHPSIFFQAFRCCSRL